MHTAYKAVVQRAEDTLSTTAEAVSSYAIDAASRSQAAIADEHKKLTEKLTFQISPLLHTLSKSISAKFNQAIEKILSWFGNVDEGIFVTALMPEESSELERARSALLGNDQEDGIVGRPTSNTTEDIVSPPLVATQPALERVVEREVVIQAGITESYVTQLLEQLNNKLSSEIYRLSSENATQIVNNYHTISQTSKIDDLGNVTVRNSSFTDGTISGSTSFSGTSGSFSGALSAASLTVSGDSSLANFIVDATSGNVGIGTTTPYAKLSVVGPVVAEYFHATSTTATSTIASRFLLTHAPTLPHTFSPWAIGAAGSAFLDATLVVNPATSVADSNLISAAVGSSVKFLVDAEGDVFVNNLTSIGDVTLAQTTASTFSVEGNTTLGDSITDVTTINGTLTVTGQTSVSTVDGNFGVGTTSPWARLSVAGVAGATTPLLSISTTTAGGATSTALHLDSSGKFGIGTSTPSNTLTVAGIANFTGNVGIGTSTPSKRLSITHTVSDAQVAIAYDDTRFAHLQVDALGDLIISSQGGDVRLNNENIFVCSGGACPSGTPTGQGNLIVETALGIGSSSPYTTLDVAGSAAFTGTIDIQSTSATSTFGHGISIGGTGSLRFPDNTFQNTAAVSGTDVQTFTSSGTWTKPSSGSIALVECWGGGGSGGKSATSGGGGDGGTPGGAGGASFWGGGGGGGPENSGATSSAGAGGNSIMGGGGGGGAGGGGGGSSPGGAGGTSVHGGNGGAGTDEDSDANATAGTQPGGGGGAVDVSAGNSGAGGAGQCRITVW